MLARNGLPDNQTLDLKVGAKRALARPLSCLDQPGGDRELHVVLVAEAERDRRAR